MYHRGLHLGASALNARAGILDKAVDDGHLERNPARSRRMRIKVPKPARTFLEMDELVALTDAAGEQDARFARPKLEVTAASGSTAARVADLWSAGRRASDIAAELGLSKATITYHLRRLRAEGPTTYLGRRAIVATLGGSGVRVSELCDMRIPECGCTRRAARTSGSPTQRPRPASGRCK
jgi:integrase